MLTKLGKYQIKSEIGSGAMGVVYRAEDSRLGRPVALKTMSARMASDAELLRRFYHEAQSAGKLRHPNIVTIYDIDEADGIPFIAMEFLEGESLEKLIATRREMPLVQKLDIMMQTCRALHYAHQHGVIHRDVKPANVMLLLDGLVKLVDFGIARVGSTSMTRTGVVLGTPLYMAPEQIRGQAVDARIDVFSAGVIGYELLTYRSPFAAPDVPTILEKIINETPFPLTTLLQNCPPELDRVVMRAMAKDREDRYQNAEDLAFDLQQVSNSLGRNMLDVYVLEGQRSLEEGNLDGAKEALQRALEIDSSHDLARNLLEQVQQHLYLRQRAQKVEDSLRRAQEAIQARRYDQAILAADDVLLLEPEHQTAQQYKQFAAERRGSIQRVTLYMERAEKYMAEADFRSAKAELDALLKLEPRNSGALKKLETVVKEIKEQERLQQARRHTEDGRNRLRERDFAGALEVLEKARALDPTDLEVEALIRQAFGAQEEEERRRVLLERQAGVEEALEREDFDRALALAEEAIEEFPDDPQVAKLHTKAVRLAASYRRRRYADAQLEAARNLLQRDQLAEAVSLLEQTLETIPDDARLAALLKTVREAQAQAELEALRRRVVREANDLIRNQDFSAAVTALEKAMTTAGDSHDLADLLSFAREQQAEQHRQEQARQVLARAQNLVLQENFEEAARLLEQGERELNSPEIGNLLAAVRKQQQEFDKRREAILRDAQQVLETREPARAMALLDAAPRAYFKDQEFMRIYALCRAAAERAAAAAVEAQRIEAHMARGELDRAQSLLRKVLRKFPDEPSLAACQKRLEEELNRFHEAQWKKALDEVKVAMGRTDYERAIKLLDQMNWEASGVPAMVGEANALRLEAQRLIEEREAQRRKWEPTSTSGGDTAPEERPRPGPPTPDIAKTSSLLAVQAEAAEKMTSSSAQPVRSRLTTEPAPPMPLTQTLWTRHVVLGTVGLVLASASLGAWLLLGHHSEPGLVELDATPWGEVVGVRNASGKPVNAAGQTPLQLALAPGEYDIEIKRGDTVLKTRVSVRPGQRASANFTFAGIRVADVVKKLVMTGTQEQAAGTDAQGASEQFLRVGLKSYFEGQYDEADRSLTRYLNDQGAQRGLSYFFRGASRSARYFLSGEKDAQQKKLALVDFQALKDIDPQFEAPGQFVSPKILALYGEARGLGSH